MCEAELHVKGTGCNVFDTHSGSLWLTPPPQQVSSAPPLPSDSCLTISHKATAPRLSHQPIIKLHFPQAAPAVTSCIWLQKAYHSYLWQTLISAVDWCVCAFHEVFIAECLAVASSTVEVTSVWGLCCLQLHCQALVSQCWRNINRTNSACWVVEAGVSSVHGSVCRDSFTEWKSSGFQK